MIAALPMYDFDDMTSANDAFWAGIRDGLRARGIAAPEALARGTSVWDIWQSPDLLLAQTCGYPFRARLYPNVELVGTPDYAVEGCAPGHYCSYFIARSDDPRRELAAFDGTALAYNEAMSQSGWAAPQNHAASLGLRFPAGQQTGSHRATAQTIAKGKADLGAVDAVTWRHLLRVEPLADTLRIVARTPATPGLPLITAKHGPAAVLFDVANQAIAQLEQTPRAILGLRGLLDLPVSVYLAVPNPPPPDQFGQ
jgi:ABC-type phosphate/phosphonate transport system substrate-binding protein